MLRQLFASSVRSQHAARHPRDTAPRCVLRRTLPGEYLSLAIMLHAGLGSVAWAGFSVRAPAGLLLVAFGLWIVCRSAGAFSRRLFTPFVTGGLLIAALALRQQEFQLPIPALAVFSLSTYIALLGVVLTFDLLDIALWAFARPWDQRLKKRNWCRVALWAIVFSLFIYAIAIPIAGPVMSRVPSGHSEYVVEEMSTAARIWLNIVEALVALWFLALGATVGSFLNVVVYRVPRGESIVFRGSRCPSCRTKIKGRDNVPVLGWLLLEGRCRQCQSAISYRYPVVETITAAIFFLLYFVELISGGTNIPIRMPNLYNGVVWIILYTKWDLVALYAFHCFALSALLVWALIDVDRQRLPARALWIVGAVLFSAPFLSPDVLPVPWLGKEVFEFHSSHWYSVAGTSIAGGLSGVLLGWIAGRALQVGQHHAADVEVPAKPSAPPTGHMISAAAIIGLSVGWQAALGIWLMALALRSIASAAARSWNFSEPPMTAVLLGAYLMHLVAWRWLAVAWWPSHETSPVAWVSIGVCFAALWLVNRSLPMFRHPMSRTDDAEITTADQSISDSANC